MTEPVLVTGGAGFIGSHLVERLVGRGRRVVVLDNFDPYYPEAVKRSNVERSLASGLVTLVTGDVRNPEALRAVITDHGVGRVVHLAARPGVRPSLEAPEPYLDINVAGTLNVLTACRDRGVRKVVFASSSSVYGGTGRPADEETSPCRPLSPYGASKVAGEALCSSFAASAGMDVVALRFFTVYGPRQRPDMAICRFTQMIADGEEVPVYGDGTSQRDYTYVSDVIDGVVAAIDTPLGGYRVFNLGRGEPVVLRDLLKNLEVEIGRKARLRYLPEQTGDPQSTCADISRARAMLGYEPSVAAADGVRLYTQWYQEKSRDRIGSR
ncbi:MAG TPA: SDR family NAD(P)-dependent oxidoreductase [Dehalococcoidia bacterium]